MLIIINNQFLYYLRTIINININIYEVIATQFLSIFNAFNSCLLCSKPFLSSHIPYNNNVKYFKSSRI